MIERFKDREWARRVNLLLVELEKVDPEEKEEIKNYIEFKIAKRKKKIAEKKSELRKIFRIV